MPPDADSINLTHHFLIAMPGLQDATFARSVVYLCEHSPRGALGLVINKPSDINLKNLFDKVELNLDREELAAQPVFYGGPVQTERGFVLHDKPAADAAKYNSTLSVPGGLDMTTSKDVLEDLASGAGPLPSANPGARRAEGCMSAPGPSQAPTPAHAARRIVR